MSYKQNSENTLLPASGPLCHFLLPIRRGLAMRGSSHVERGACIVPAHLLQTAKYEPEPNHCSDFRAEHLGQSRTSRFFLKLVQK